VNLSRVVIEIEFAPSFQRHTEAAKTQIEAHSLKSALQEAFHLLPALRGYVLDDQGAIRKHVTIFINDQTIADRVELSDSLRDGDREIRFANFVGRMKMNSTLHVGTRKGLFQVAKHKGDWQIVKADFLGAQVPILHVSRDGNTIFAGLKHGHFGAKMHRSSDGGTTWQEIATPAYPPKPDDVPDIIDQMRNVAIP
jgi:hypothetical protein